MYRVWCYKYFVLELYSCGDNERLALKMLSAYFAPPLYLSWLEYIKEPKGKEV